MVAILKATQEYKADRIYTGNGGCPAGSTAVAHALHAIRRLRSEIDKLLGSDRILCLVVAIETALADERYEVRHHRGCVSSPRRRDLRHAHRASPRTAMLWRSLAPCRLSCFIQLSELSPCSLDHVRIMLTVRWRSHSAGGGEAAR